MIPITRFGLATNVTCCGVALVARAHGQAAVAGLERDEERAVRRAGGLDQHGLRGELLAALVEADGDALPGDERRDRAAHAQLSPRSTTWSWPSRCTRSSLSAIAPAAGAGAGAGVGVGVGAGGVGVGAGGTWALAAAVKVSGNRLPMMIAATRRIERGIVHAHAAKFRKVGASHHPARVTPAHPRGAQHASMASTASPTAAPEAKAARPARSAPASSGQARSARS